MTFQRALSKLLGASSSAVLARGAGGTFVVRVLGAFGLYGTHILLARVMGAEHYGTYAYTVTWCSVFVLAGKMGLDTSIVRFVAAYNAQGEWGRLRGLLRRSDQLALLASLVTTAVVASVVWILRARLGPELARTFWIASALLPVMSLVLLRYASLRALGHPVLATSVDSVLRPALLALLVGASVLWLRGSVNGPTAMGFHGLSLVGCLLAGGWWLGRHMPAAVSRSEARFRDREWLGTALSMLFMSGMLVILNRTDTIMIGAMVGTKEAGVYSVASKTATLMLFALWAVNVALAPMISALHVSGKRKELQRVVTLAARGIFAFSFPAGLVLILAGRHILGAFGAEFTAAYRPLVILAAAQLVNVLAGSVGFLMIMTGHQRRAAAVLGVSAALNVVLNAVLIPRFGLTGAAAATAATTVLWNVGMLVYVVGKLGVDPTILGAWRPKEG